MPATNWLKSILSAITAITNDRFVIFSGFLWRFWTRCCQFISLICVRRILFGNSLFYKFAMIKYLYVWRHLTNWRTLLPKICTQFQIITIENICTKCGLCFQQSWEISSLTFASPNNWMGLCQKLKFCQFAVFEQLLFLGRGIVAWLMFGLLEMKKLTQ